MTDSWSLLCFEEDGFTPAGEILQISLKVSTVKIAPLPGIAASFYKWQTYDVTPKARIIKVYRNGVLYAKVNGDTRYIATGQPTGNGFMIDLDVYDRELIAMELSQGPREPVCTCGGWVVYGKEADLHADNLVNQCELRVKR